jgi:hypothetical protein
VGITWLSVGLLKLLRELPHNFDPHIGGGKLVKSLKKKAETAGMGCQTSR